MTTYSRTERVALCDLFDGLGPDAPTLCGTWRTRDLAAHLFVRERRPQAVPGILLPPLSQLVDRTMSAAQDRYAYTKLVDLLRGGAPKWSPFGIMDSQLNLLEYFVHHEDVRRAQPDWAPRTLDPAEQNDLWNRLGDRLAVMMRKAPVGVLLQRSDTGDVARGRAGPPTVALVGPPAELVLYAYGRQRVARVEAYGEPAAVAQLGDTPLAV